MTLPSDFEGILECGVKAVIPTHLVDNVLSAVPNGVKIYDKTFTYSGSINVFGFGKAALALVKQTVRVLGPRVENIVCCHPQPSEDEIVEFPELFSEADLSAHSSVYIYHGSRNNEPTAEVFEASLTMAQIASNMKSGDLLIVCITGGGSALLTLPAPLEPGASLLDVHSRRVSLDDIITTTKLLSLDGASIQEINTVRSCLDLMKAGGLARFAAPAQTVSLILSDIVGDQIRFIASGPTFVESEVATNRQTDPVSAFDRALAILRKHKLVDKVPSDVKHLLRSRTLSSTARIVEPKPVNIIIGNVAMALEAAANEAAKMNPSCLHTEGVYLSMDVFRRTPVERFEVILPIVLTDKLDGNMTEKAVAMADLSWELRRLIQVFLLKPESTSRHVTEATRNRIQEAQRRVLGTKAYYRDLIHACHQVAKCAREALASPPHNSNHRFLGGICLLLGGEATVKVSHHGENSNPPPIGGRCSHAALTAALRFHELRADFNNHTPLPRDPPASVRAAFFGRASDGLDGPMAFGAGAWATEALISNSAEAQMARECLDKGDSYGYFVRGCVEHDKGGYLPAKLTGTNVMDMFMCLVGVYA